MGVAVGDVNNDGFPDIYVSCYGGDRLFLNQRDGSFLDITEAAGIENQHWGASAVFVDFDRDGWLDLFVTNYVDYDPGQPCLAGGRQDFCNPAVFPGTPDRLYRNISGRLNESSSVESRVADDLSEKEADTANLTETSAQVEQVKFEDVSLSSGIARKLGPGLGVICADLTGDGWPDIYVANDGYANFLWVNQRDGTFRDEAPLRGVAYDATGRSQGSMGIAIADVNRDGLLDLLVTNLDGENNALYLSQTEAGFREGSTSAGLGPSYPHTGFGTALIDLNHNGLWEMLIVNGRVRRIAQTGGNAGQTSATTDVEKRQGPSPFDWDEYGERNLLFQQQTSGAFRLVEHPADPFLAGFEVTRALAIGDIDNDGDLDLVLTNSGGTLRLLRNDAPKEGRWLSLRVIDSRYGGRDAYGARVTVVRESHKWTQVVQPGASYLSSHDPRLHFGLGNLDEIDQVQVVWPDGHQETFPGGPVNQFRTITFGTGMSP
jgi:enediyne biosynthesis protein E4